MQIHCALEMMQPETLLINSIEIAVALSVNCAGIGPHLVANLMELPEGLPSKILRVNILATVKVNSL